MPSPDTIDWAIEEAAKLGWSSETPNKKGYVRLKCPCGKHLAWLHKTPSNPNHYKQKVGHLKAKCP